MFECVEETKESRRVVRMKNMEPLQIGRIIDNDSPYEGDIVMRTASRNHFEVMMLSPNPGQGMCWTDDTIDWEIELLPAGTRLILTVK